MLTATEIIPTLRPYQSDAISQVENVTRPGQRTLVISPTGTGKSEIALALLAKWPGSVIVTPKEDIQRQMASKRWGANCLNCDRSWIEERGIWTPLRLRKTDRLPVAIIWDEAHHAVCPTWQDIRVRMVQQGGLEVGLTATPYCGTAIKTALFDDLWASRIVALDMSTAISQGYRRPITCTTIPLVDDDLIEIRNGEYTVQSVTAHTKSKLVQLADIVAESASRFSTVCWLPSVEILDSLAGLLKDKAAVVSAQTPMPERMRIYSLVVARAKALLNINVVSEGVDLPLECGIDARPTNSPLLWMQTIGRLRGSAEHNPVYTACNRNFLNYGYLLQGMPGVGGSIEQASLMFPPSTRQAWRIFGVDSFGKMKPIEFQLNDNRGTGLMFMVESAALLDDCKTVEVAAISLGHRVIWATKIRNPLGATKAEIYGRWRYGHPQDFAGYTSAKPYQVTTKMYDLWVRLADRHGLFVDQEIKPKIFQVLTVLMDLGLRV